MSSEPGEASEVGKLVDEWVMLEDEGNDYFVGMIGERTLVGDKPSFAERADGSGEIVIVGPVDADGRRRVGIHRRPS